MRESDFRRRFEFVGHLLVFPDRCGFVKYECVGLLQKKRVSMYRTVSQKLSTYTKQAVVDWAIIRLAANHTNARTDGISFCC